MNEVLNNEMEEDQRKEKEEIDLGNNSKNKKKIEKQLDNNTVIRAKNYLGLIMNSLKKIFELNSWDFKNYENLTHKENYRIKEIYKEILKNLRETHVELFKNNIQLYKNDTPLIVKIIKATPLALRNKSDYNSFNDIYQAVTNSISTPTKTFREAIRLLNPKFEIKPKRISNYLEGIVDHLKNKYQNTPWKFENYNLNTQTEREKKLIKTSLKEILDVLRRKHPNKFLKQRRLHKTDYLFLSRVIMAAPLIIDKKNDSINSVREIFKIVYEKEKNDINPTQPFHKAVRQFFKDFESSKFKKWDYENIVKKGEFTLKEEFFLKNHGININNLESKWGWVDLRPELVPRYFRYVVFPQFEKNPRVIDIDEKMGQAFRQAVSRKLGKTLWDIQYLAGLSSKYNKTKINNFFSDKNSLESHLIKNLCHILNFSISDIGKNVFTLGNTLRSTLIDMELTSKRGSYIGFKDETVEKINDFINNLPNGDEIDDDFHKIIIKRKNNAIETFNRYLDLQALYRKSQTTKGYDYLGFNWNRENYKNIKDCSIKSKLDLIFQNNEKRDFPLNILLIDNPRCSRFYIRGSLKNPISSKELNILSNKLISSRKIIKNSGLGINLIKYVEKLERISQNSKDMLNLDGSIKHEPLLSYILNKEKYAIAKEIFIWKPIQNNKNASFLTGHIDILLIKDNKICVVDYKPDEKNLLRSIPQIASYGLILSEILDLEVNKIRCISFNRNEAWEYCPSILLDNINKVAESLKKNHPTLNLEWMEYFNK